MDDKLKKYVATCLIIMFLGILTMEVISVNKTIEVADQEVFKVNQSLNADPTNVALKGEYNKAVRSYLGATAYFPGNIVGMVTGHNKDKWSLFNEQFGTFWSPPPKALMNRSNLSTPVGGDLKWATPQ